MLCTRRTFTNGEDQEDWCFVGCLIGVKEKLLEMKERLLTVLKVIDEELGQGFVTTHEDKMGLGSVKPLGDSAGLGTMKRQWAVKGKKQAHELCALWASALAMASQNEIRG